MNLLLGIGNSDRGDDGVGPYIAGQFKHSDWICLDAGTAPENFTGVVRKHQPEILLMIDAADMGLPPGTIRRVPRALIQDTGWSTHMLPLYHIMDYLADTVRDEIIVVGIQPADKEYGAVMTEPVVRAAGEILNFLHTGKLDQIPSL